MVFLNSQISTLYALCSTLSTLNAKRDSGFISTETATKLLPYNKELTSMLISSIKTAKQSLKPK